MRHLKEIIIIWVWLIGSLALRDDTCLCALAAPDNKETAIGAEDDYDASEGGEGDYGGGNDVYEEGYEEEAEGGSIAHEEALAGHVDEEYHHDDDQSGDNGDHAQEGEDTVEGKSSSSVSDSSRAADHSQDQMELEDQIYETTTPSQLYALWRAAKHHLAMSGKVPLDVKLSQMLTLVDQSVPEASRNDEERKLFRDQSLEWLQKRVYSVLSHHPHLGDMLGQKHSNRHFNGWDDHDEDGGAKEDAPHGEGNDDWFSSMFSSIPPDVRRKYQRICRQSSLDHADGLVRLAQLLLFERQVEAVESFCRPFIDALQPESLLRKAVELNEGGTAGVRAELLLSILAISRHQLEGEDGDHLQKVYNRLMQIAFEGNHPIAHLLLARFFASSPRPGISENDLTASILGSKRSSSSDRRDCERAASHLLQAIEATLHNVRNLLTGTLERHDRLSRIHETGLGYDDDISGDGIVALPLHSRQDFYEQEMHLLELARGANRFDDGGGAGDDRGALALQLGDLYYFGAPEFGIHPQLARAERMYRRALRARNAQAASHLATMTFNGETAGTVSQRELDHLDQHGPFDDDEDDDDEDADRKEDDSASGGHNKNQTAFALYAAAARWGDPMGHIGLGVFYLSGGAPQVAEINATQALEHFEKAAEGGVSEGDYRAARIYLYSSGKLFNRSSGLFRMQRAAEAGHVNAAYEMGLYLLEEEASFSDDDGCEASLEYLLSAMRADWTELVPFDATKGLRAYLQGRENDALNIYLMADAGLWQRRAMVNAAFLLEKGHLPMMDSNWTYSEAVQTTWDNLAEWSFNKGLSYMETLMQFLGVALFTPSVARVPAYTRRDESGRRRTRWAKRLYERIVVGVDFGSEVGFADRGEALRKLAECFWEGWNGVCDVEGDGGDDDDDDEDARKKKGTWLFQMAAEEMGDAPSRWMLGNLRRFGLGGLQRNLTRAMEEYDEAYDLDEHSWFLVEMSRLVLAIEDRLWSDNNLV